MNPLRQNESWHKDFFSYRYDGTVTGCLYGCLRKQNFMDETEEIPEVREKTRLEKFLVLTWVKGSGVIKTRVIRLFSNRIFVT